MANKDELLKTINDAFEELAKDVDDQSAEYKIMFDPPDPPVVDKESDSPGVTKISFEKFI